MPEVLTAFEIGGVVMTAIAAGITFFRTRPEYRGVLALNVALLGAVVTLLVSVRHDLLPELIRQHEESEALSAENFLDGYLEALTLGNRVEDPLFQSSIERRVRDFQESLEDFRAERYVIYQHELNWYAPALIRSAERSIEATSFVDPTKWWEEGWGEDYSRLHRDLVADGVEITRYFIVADEEELEKLLPLMRQQVEWGVDVRTVRVSDLSSQHESDIIIIDDEIVGTLVLGATTRSPEQAIMSRARGDILKAKDRLRNMSPLSNPVPLIRE